MKNNIILLISCSLSLVFLSCNKNTQRSENGTVRDKLWLWGHIEGSHNGRWNLPSGDEGSQITIADACNYMDIKNCIVVEFEGKPESGTEATYAAQLSDCKRVGWSAVGANSPHSVISDHLEPVRTILKLSDEFPNINEVMFDDFFTADKPRVTLNQLIEMRDLLHERENPLDMWVVVYDFNLEKFLKDDYLQYFDVLNFWTWESENLEALEANLVKLRSRVPGKRIVLGCYMYDYGIGKPIPVTRMAAQCQLGLRLLNEGVIEGMVFLASCICDLNIDAVEWTREWITHVGNYNVGEIDLEEVALWSEQAIGKYNK